MESNMTVPARNEVATIGIAPSASAIEAVLSGRSLDDLGKE